MVDHLLPCPFCYGKAEFERVGTSKQSTVVTCSECGARLETNETFNAGQQWNERSKAMSAAMTEAYCSEGSDDDDMKECFLHHIRTTIGFLAFGSRTGPEMTMYEEGFKAGYRRCKADNEPELGEADDIANAIAAAEERGRMEERERCQEKQEHPIVGADRVYKVLKKYRDEGRFDWDHIGYICRDVAAITQEPTP